MARAHFTLLLPPPFEIHALKTIGHLLGLVLIYPECTILLTKSVLKISRENQLGQTTDRRTDGRTDRRTDGEMDRRTMPFLKLLLAANN